MNENIGAARELTLDYRSWHVEVGKVITEYSKKEEPALYGTFDIWFDCGDLLDWISLEFVRRRYEGTRKITPTEMLNADGCRAFGQLNKAGFSGSAFVVASKTPRLIQELAKVSSVGRSVLLISIINIGNSSWSMTARTIWGG